MRIFVVEDERDLNRVISKRLMKELYSVDSCYNGEEALDYINTGEFDTIILDIMMPKLNGIEVVKTMRAKKNTTPVLFLTAKDSVSDRVTGLDTGAEDYLVKPFAFEELLARIRVILRKQANETTNIFNISNLSVDIATRQVKRGSNSINLSAKEFDILEYLIRNKGKVIY